MDFFIEMRDGAPYGHPILDSNFREVYPDIDTQNLPSNFARFVRTAPPSNVGMFEVEESTYQIIDGVVTDVWTIRPLEGEQYAMRVDMLRRSLEDYIENQKAIAQGKIVEATDPAVKAAWEDYLAIVSAMVITDPVVQQHQMPMMPRVTEDGLVYTTSSPGSAPNVIE